MVRIVKAIPNTAEESPQEKKCYVTKPRSTSGGRGQGSKRVEQERLQCLKLQGDGAFSFNCGIQMLAVVRLAVAGRRQSRAW